MKHALFVSICLLVGTAVAAPLPPITTCGIGEPVPCVTVVVGDIVVGDGETEQYNNGTYAFQGNVTVESGGVVEMILSDVSFADDAPVHVQAGGTIVIDGSSLTGTPTAATPVIQLDPGAQVTIVGSNFTYLTLSLASNDATVEYNNFEFGAPAVRLTDYDGEFRENDFQNNVEGINATGGTPTFTGLDFNGDSMAIRLDGVQCVIEHTDMTNVLDGVSITGGACFMTSMRIDDQSFPPDIGFEIIDGVGQSEISFNDISNFGVGIYYCNADVNIHDNSFSGNGQDVVSC